MLIDATTQTLEIKLAGAVNSNEVPIVLAYIDGEASNFFPTLQHSISNGATEVTILNAPEPRGKRMVKFMYIRNTDDATIVLTLQLADGATNREIYKVSLLQDETLSYTDTTGFKIIDTDGNTKVGGGGGFAAPTGSIDIADSAAEGSESTHTRSDHQHAFTAPSSGYPLDVADAEADGSASTPARSDHVHSHGTSTLSNAHDITDLAEYVEGTFTPVAIFAAGSGTITYTTQTGAYTRIGNVVFFRLELLTLSIASRTGVMTIGGLPLTSGVTHFGGIAVGFAAGLAITANQVVAGHITPSSTEVVLVLWDATTGTSGLLDTEWTDDGRIVLTGQYITDA
ncbi:hypothetical protein LCGC14_0474510 [marine sediment metagenome]|uniref:Uncharacterized protein n=1 Tax=marine sediment metagenome TaxID=412755 RepID=A0A0F9UY54_9ZZZZ